MTASRKGVAVTLQRDCGQRGEELQVGCYSFAPERARKREREERERK